ncbi:hypothetical protein [uncultured Sphingomonas sp.]|uniref:hypothetical protein n=1 Tax=uncultured Sphingomonas sp. TaxID=158754 RepID=UPI0025FA4382|nr:hypothetical protein [uncultured Sphingomonas sp.]
MTPLGHIAGTIAIWAMMLFGLRFSVAAIQWLRPVRQSLWHLARCEGPDRTACFAAFNTALDQLHLDLHSAMRTPWSVPLLFSGSALVGLAFATGCIGDAMMLVTRQRAAWEQFDLIADCFAAVFGIPGMALVHAATARRRTVSFSISALLVLTGFGVGVVTL